ncbi:hypothetical protein GCM10010393_39240 [Streptomyces gobitricini]|uniref:Uncharacterized protein n=1 Tax=Streptomyces gobitricini TaxID=68211 RepID=A0ABP5ZVQ0_9ACTN
MRPVQQAPGRQGLGVPARGHGRDAQLCGEVRDPGRAALPHQGEQTVVTFNSTLAHGKIPSGCGGSVERRPSSDPESPRKHG